ncbi:unnamed protein product [Mytilus edulis]|uniref:Uncharacterized protein n=1 Tax=Mytilus edulis TaxID=6550 RepID=A0A8S3SEK4_MYTED|nr:unnamed protein product [Mytilus edulis]
MNLKDKNLSLQLYNYLCNIVGSEKVVKTRREIFYAKDIGEKTTEITFISSGSKAEGIDLKGSDYDQMILFNIIHVYQNLNDVQYDENKIQLVMDTNDTKPGFTKLKLVNEWVDVFTAIFDWCETVGEETYISSKFYREQHLMNGMVTHGPCQSTPNGDYDQAGCFRCEEWITIAQPWIHRSQNNLFEVRFTVNDHEALLDTLRFVYGSPWTSVFHTETFQNYKLQSVNSHSMALSASALSCFSYNRVTHNPLSIYSLFKGFENRYNTNFRKDICACTLCECASVSIQSSDLVNLEDKNKSFYQRYKRLFVLFKISLQSNSVSSWLLLASLFYKCKRFLECLDIINYCLFSCTPHMIDLHPANSLAEQTVFKQMKQILGLLLALKHLLIEYVCFRHPFYLLPNELMSLITDVMLHFPPVVYSYVLQFLCCYHLDDKRGKKMRWII